MRLKFIEPLEMMGGWI